jgi:hypothetical protein
METPNLLRAQVFSECAMLNPDPDDSPDDDAGDCGPQRPAPASYGLTDWMLLIF